MKHLLPLLTLLSSCGGDNGSAIDASVPAVDAAAPPTQTTFGGLRPTQLLVPSAYDHSAAMPLLVVLHGYTSSGAVTLNYTGFGDLVEQENIFVLAPDGTVDDNGNPFWNATSACCDFAGTGVDDVAYLHGLITEVSGVYKIDPQQVFVWGHSNGGFMAHRLACEHADAIAGIVSLAGAQSLELADCNPNAGMQVLQIHGDADETISFTGGATCQGGGCQYPSADQTMTHWAALNGCSATRSLDSARLDLDINLQGQETHIEHVDDCPEGAQLDLWVIEGGSHVPVFQTTFRSEVWAWMRDHRKL